MSAKNDAEDKPEPPKISWVQVASSSLAALSSAVLLSTLGVAGTLIGAALGSIVFSVGSNLYNRGIQASHKQVSAQTAAVKRVAAARTRLDTARDSLKHGEPGAAGQIRAADRALSEAEEALHESVGDGTSEGGDEPESSTDPVERAWSFSGLPWKRIALVAAGVFVVTMVTITAFELATGRPVSAYTGGSDRESGTTVPGISRGDSTPEQEAPTDNPGDVPTDELSPEPTAEDPGTTPAPEETPPADGTPVAPTEEPSAPAEPTPTPAPGGVEPPPDAAPPPGEGPDPGLNAEPGSATRAEPRSQPTELPRT